MKTMTKSAAVMTLLFTGLAVAKTKKDPAEYPLSAHVLSIKSHGGVSGVSTSSYNSQTGQWSYGHGTVDSQFVAALEELMQRRLAARRGGRPRKSVSDSRQPDLSFVAGTA